MLATDTNELKDYCYNSGLLGLEYDLGNCKLTDFECFSNGIAHRIFNYKKNTRELLQKFNLGTIQHKFVKDLQDLWLLIEGQALSHRSGLSSLFSFEDCASRLELFEKLQSFCDNDNFYEIILNLNLDLFTKDIAKIILETANVIFFLVLKDLKSGEMENIKQFNIFPENELRIFKQFNLNIQPKFCSLTEFRERVRIVCNKEDELKMIDGFPSIQNLLRILNDCVLFRDSNFIRAVRDSVDFDSLIRGLHTASDNFSSDAFISHNYQTFEVILKINNPLLPSNDLKIVQSIFKKRLKRQILLTHLMRRSELSLKDWILYNDFSFLCAIDEPSIELFEIDQIVLFTQFQRRLTEWLVNLDKFIHFKQEKELIKFFEQADSSFFAFINLI